MDSVTLSANTALSAGLQQQAAAQASSLKSASGDPKKARAAAQQFEGFFVSQMMDNMMEGIQPDEIFGGGFAEETWRSMLNQQYGKEIAKSGNLGIADSVVGSMLKMQDEANSKAAAASQMDGQGGAQGGSQVNAASASMPAISSAAAAAAYRAPAATAPVSLSARVN